MGLHFGACFGSLNNLSWLASEGFAEAGVTVAYPSMPSITGSAIRAAGIPYANLDWFNDYPNPGGPGVAGASLAGSFQSAAGQGWNTCGGEGVGGSVAATLENYMIMNNLAGDVGGYQMDAYGTANDPQPKSGGKGHTDYIETYVSGTTQCAASTIQRIQQAKSYGSIFYGPLIEDFSTVLGWGAQYYIDIIDQSGANAVFFWGGYSDSSAGLQGDLSGIYSAIKSKYGMSKTAASGGAVTTSGSTTAAAPHPVITCPCRHLWLSFKGVTGNSTSEKIEFKVLMQGKGGWVDNNDKQIPNRPYTGKLQLWARNAKKTWMIQEFWPAKDGTFAIWIGSDTAETRYYNVRFADSGSSPPYQTVMEG